MCVAEVLVALKDKLRLLVLLRQVSLRTHIAQVTQKPTTLAASTLFLLLRLLLLALARARGISSTVTTPLGRSYGAVPAQPRTGCNRSAARYTWVRLVLHKTPRSE